MTDQEDGSATEEYFSLREDIGVLRHAIEEKGASLLIIDPVQAFMPACDTHRDADVRTLLMPLAKMAQELQCAVVLIGHVNKKAGDKV